MKMQRIQVPLEVKAADDGKTIVGYGSVFGNIDAYGDTIASGAFEASLSEHTSKGTVPAMLWQHNPDWPIGKWTDIAEDERGLKVTGMLADTAQARDVGALVRMGAITGASIGFITRKSEMDEKTGIRTLKEIDLWEVSLVTFPANEAARVEARAADIDEMGLPEIEGLLREAGMSRREAKSVLHRVMSFGSLREADELRKAAKRQVAAAALRAAAPSLSL